MRPPALLPCYAPHSASHGCYDGKVQHRLDTQHNKPAAPNANSPTFASLMFRIITNQHIAAQKYNATNNMRNNNNNDASSSSKLNECATNIIAYIYAMCRIFPNLVLIALERWRVLQIRCAPPLQWNASLFSCCFYIDFVFLFS